MIPTIQKLGFLSACWLVLTCPTSVGAAPLEVESVVLRLLSEAQVPAQEAGVLTSLRASEGQLVKRGAVLAKIDDRVVRLAEQSADLQHHMAQARVANDVRRQFASKALEVAEAELRRSTESIAKFARSISQSQLDVERLTVQKSRLEHTQAEHESRIEAFELQLRENELALARIQIERRQIIAPFDGMVVQVFVRPGEWVEPGQKVMRIVGVHRLKAEGFLPAEQASSDLTGALVQVIITLANKSEARFPGKITFVSPEMDPITGQVHLWAEIENHKGQLRPGQPVRMVIEK